MKFSSLQRLAMVALSVLLLTGGLHLALAQSPPPSVTVVHVNDLIVLPDTQRLGLNLGYPDRYGAAHLLKNIIHNPGFEADEFGMLFFTLPGATVDRVQQDNWQTEWNSARVGQPEQFWENAAYEILTGARAGESGSVAAFQHVDNRNTYTLTPASAAGTARADGVLVARPAGAADATATAGAVAVGDEVLIRVTKVLTGYEEGLATYSAADPTTTRPGSPGVQSLRLLPSAGAWEPSFRYFLDSYGRDGDATAGKLLRVAGNWQFSIWARGSSNGDTLRVTFRREGLTPFLDQTFELDTEWQMYTSDFFVPADADPEEWESAAAMFPVLEVALWIDNANGIWVDDISLARVDGNEENPTVFNNNLVARLREYRPGILRNWGGQLGSSLENELAEPFARRPTGHSPRERVADTFSYSLHDFLTLAALVEAEPWYVIPPTWSAEELAGLVDYLAAPAGSSVWADRRAALGQSAAWTEVFPQIHLEFGNELWGANAGPDPFIGATLRGGERTGEVAAARLAVLRANPNFDAERLHLIVGGQYNAPETQARIAGAGGGFDTVALAPYFGELDEIRNDREIFYPLFARPTHDMQSGEFAQGLGNLALARTPLNTAIYEINFHSTFGNVPLSVRNGFVTGLAGGIAMPLYMLTYQKALGIRNQAAFTAVQYSFRIENGDYVRVWGLLRDLEATGRKRPTWLGAELANRAVRGDMLQTVQEGDNPTWRQEAINGLSAPVDVPFVQSFAFREGDSYALVLFNLHLRDEQIVVVETQSVPDPAAVRHTLTAESIHHDNETAPLVAIASEQIDDFSQAYELRLPRHSMTVLEWGAVGAAPPLVAIQQPATIPVQPAGAAAVNATLTAEAGTPAVAPTPSPGAPRTLGELWQQTRQNGLLSGDDGLSIAVLALLAVNLLAVGLIVFFVARWLRRRRRL